MQYASAQDLAVTGVFIGHYRSIDEYREINHDKAVDGMGTHIFQTNPCLVCCPRAKLGMSRPTVPDETSRRFCVPLKVAITVARELSCDIKVTLKSNGCHHVQY